MKLLKMLSLCLPALLVADLAKAQVLPPVSATDKTAIVAVLQRITDNYNDHKFEQMPGYTTPDVTWINIVGMWWQGEPNVQLGHQAVFDRIYKGVKFQPVNPDDLTFRAITPDVVLVTAGGKAPTRTDAPPPGVTAATSGPQVVGTKLMVKRQGRWLLTAGQQTVVDSQAVASNPVH